MPMIETKDGVSLFYKDWGPKDGPTVTLSHGWPLSSDSWESQAFFLASRGFRVVSHDRRGHGRSDQPWDGNDMDHYADDLAAVIDALGLRDVTVVGFSTGGGEVARYVGRHGTGKVARIGLVVGGPALDGQDRQQPGRPAGLRLRRHPRRLPRQSRQAVPRHPERPVLRLQPARRAGRPGHDRLLVAAGDAGRPQEHLRIRSRPSPRPTSART